MPSKMCCPSALMMLQSFECFTIAPPRADHLVHGSARVAFNYCSPSLMRLQAGNVLVNIEPPTLVGCQQRAQKMLDAQINSCGELHAVIGRPSSPRGSRQRTASLFMHVGTTSHSSQNDIHLHAYRRWQLSGSSLLALSIRSDN